jgi:MBOAT, membrane-bound O-acyltransferase family
VIATPLESPDVLLRLGAELAQWLAGRLALLGVPPAGLEWCRTAMLVLELALLVSLVAMAMAALRRGLATAPVGGPRRWLVEAAFAGLLVVVYRLARRLIRYPSREIAPFLVRWDHLVFTVLAGTVLARLPVRARTWALAALSATVVLQYTSWSAVAVVMGAALVGYLASRWEPTRRPGVRVLVHGGLVTGVIGTLFALRSVGGDLAPRSFDLWQFILFRHISFVVETARGMPADLRSYLCYLLFYPNCFGTMEVYREFHERNLRADAPPPDLAAGVRGAAVGAALMAIGLSMPAPDPLTATTTLQAWTDTLGAFLRSAVFVTGLWSSIESGARFYGVELRPNFSGVLTATSPSRFWRAWRATMTNWLVQYIYIPLGGNRRHRTFNIFAVFVVSTTWHCLGILFLHPFKTTPLWYAPIVLWGLVNFAGVALHSAWRRRWPERSYPQPTRTLVLTAKIAGTFCFGSITVLLLNFSLGEVDRFVPLLCTLTGFPGRCG